MTKEKTKKIKRVIKIIVLCLFLFLLALPFLNMFLFRPGIHRSLKDWETGKYIESELSHVKDVIPTPGECDGYEKASFYWYEPKAIFSYALALLMDREPFTYSVCLELKFGEDNYAQKKEELLSRYPYLEAPVREEDGDLLMPVSKGKIGNYDIQIMDDRDGTPSWENKNFTDYPKRFGFVAFNDEKRIFRIGYVSDASIDFYYSSESFKRHIRSSFVMNWN